MKNQQQFRPGKAGAVVVATVAAAGIIFNGALAAAPEPAHAAIASARATADGSWRAAPVRELSNAAVIAPMAAPAPAPAPDEITGLVWLDADADGTNDVGEHGLVGQQVYLIAVNGESSLITATNPDGTYTFTELDESDTYILHVETPPLHTITVGGADNDVHRAGLPNIGRSVAVSPGTSLDVAVRPQWEVQLGTWGGGPLSGTAPFGTMPESVCPSTVAPGDDCSASDDVVRAADTVSFLWSVSASNPEGSLTGPLADVVIEQTLVPAPGANIAAQTLPTRCLPSNGGGTPPPTSRVTENADGSITIICNLGTWTESGTAELVQFDVQVEASENGSTFSSRTVAYSTVAEITGGDGTTPPTSMPNAVPSPAIDDEFTISAAFRYDLNKAQYDTPVTRYYDPDGDGPMPTLRGRQFQYVFAISSPGIANEPLQQPITITDELVFTAGTQTTPFGEMEHYVVNDQCLPNNGAHAAVPMGSPMSNPARGVSDSGTCVVSRTGGATDPYTFTLNGIDDSGTHYPTQYANGTGDLSAGPYFIASYKVAYFVPDRALDAFDGIAANGVGSGWVGNRIAGFDPVSTTGGENYGGLGEPGSCDVTHDIYAATPLDTGCAQMPAGAASNNVVPGVPISIGAPSFTTGLAKNFYRPRAGEAWGTGMNKLRDGLVGDPSPFHGGGGIQAPGEISISNFRLSVGGEVGARNIVVCDAFDNTVQRLTPASAHYSDAPDGVYAWLNQATPTGYAGSAGSDWVYEYGAFERPADDPLFNPARLVLTGIVNSSFYPGVDTYSPATGRFEGVWSDQLANVNGCATATPPGGWQTDPTAVPGGIDAVNVVRVRQADPAAEYGNTMSSTYLQLNFAFLLTARDEFYGGPHDGEQIPDSTVMANFEAFSMNRFDTGAAATFNSTYSPSPENDVQSGDRITLSRAQLALKKNTVATDGYASGASAIDVTGNANAGDMLVWQIQPTIASSIPTYSLSGLTVTDVIPAAAFYDAACTAAITGGTVPDLVELNTPAAGQTRLTWYLADQLAGDAVPTLRYCTLTDATSAAGTNVVNTASFAADGIPTTTAATDTHTVTLAQPGQIALQKYVDAPIDELDDDQQYRMVVKNLSALVAMDAVKIIEVFPHNGDATNSAGANRTPGSSFSGSLELTGEVSAIFNEDPAGPAVPGTMYYTADAPTTVDQNWNTNTSRWCTYSGGSFTGASGSGDCPVSFSDVTAIKFEATASLQPDAQAGGTRDSMEISFTLQAEGNRAGDIYADRFTVVTPTVLASNEPDAPMQVLQSNRVAVEVFQFVLGDLVFVDVNNNGRYDTGDLLAPDGVTVQLWSAGPDGTFGGGDDELIDTTTTTDGLYLFDGIPDGVYYVVIPDSEFEADGLLFPWVPSNSVGGEDENDDVSQDGVGVDGRVVSALHTLSYQMVGGLPRGDEPLGDNTHGLILAPSIGDSFTNLTVDLAVVPDATLGDTVWFDLNGDGIIDGDEEGIAGVTVTAVWLGLDGVPGGGDDVTYTTTTDANGNYLFEGLPGGQYTVTVSGLDADFVPSYDLDGVSTPGTTTVSLPAGGERLDADFGYTVLFSLGNRVWSDVDGDGVYTDGTDTPVPDGVSVELYDAGGDLIATTVTAGGLYLFEDLPGGSYYVVIPATQFTAGGPLANWVVAPDGVAAPNDDADDTADHNGLPLTGVNPRTGVRTGTITLSATLSADGSVVGDEPDGYANLTVDIALLAPGAVQLQKTVVDPTPAAPGRATEFDVELICLLPGDTVETTYEVTLTSDGETASFVLPAGSLCRVDEPDSNGATPSFSPDGAFTVGASSSVEVTITNTYEAGLTTVNLRKVVVDPTPAAPGRADEFPVLLACIAPGETVAVEHDIVLNIDGTVETVSGILIGSVCTVTETATNGAAVTIDPEGAFTAGAAGVSVTVTNTYEATPLPGLATTGATVAPLVVLASSLLAAGALLLLGFAVRRRRGGAVG